MILPGPCHQHLCCAQSETQLWRLTGAACCHTVRDKCSELLRLADDAAVTLRNEYAIQLLKLPKKVGAAVPGAEVPDVASAPSWRGDARGFTMSISISLIACAGAQPAAGADTARVRRRHRGSAAGASDRTPGGAHCAVDAMRSVP